MYKPIKKYKIPVDPLGYKNPKNKNKQVIIPDNSITMRGIDFPVLGVDNLGNSQVMQPNQDYVFPGSEVLETPLMKSGGLIKRADGSYSKRGLWDNIRANKSSGKKPTAQMLEQERKINYKQQGGQLIPPTLKQISEIGRDPNFKPLPFVTPNNSNNTRIPIIPRKLTKEELSKNAVINQKQQEGSNNYELKQKNQRDINRASKGDFSGKHPFHIEDKLRVFPDSYGGWGELADEYLNPAFLIGKMASNLGNGINKSIDTKSFKPLVAPIAEPLVLGAMGFDPAGSVIKKVPNVINQTYKINPWAFKPNPESYYRVVGKDAINDALESNLIRTKSNNVKSNKGIVLNNRPTAFPSFSKGKISTEYAEGLPEHGLIETTRAMSPSNLGRHGKGTTQFPINSEGNYIKEFPLNEATLYKKDWLQGYKKIPVEKKPIFSQPEITKEPINYYDMPGFKERNPKIIDWENYKGDVKLRNNVEITDDLKPFIKMQTGGFKPLKTTSDYIKEFNLSVNPEPAFKPADLSTPKNIGDSLESFEADPMKFAQNNPVKLENNQINNGKSILGNYPVDAYTKKKENIKKNEGFSYIPSLVNGVLGSIGNSMERNRQDEYTRTNLANPFNYLPMNNNTNTYVNKGVQIAQEGGEVEDDYEEDDDNWDFDFEEETPEQIDNSSYLAEQLAAQQEVEEEPIFIPEDDEDISSAIPSSGISSISKNNIIEEPVSTNKKLSAAVRNNNPGNLKYSQFTKELGAKKGDMAADGDNSHHAYFDTPEQGLFALKKLITSGGYKNLPVNKALNRWITGSPNKQGVYSERVGKMLNNKPVKDLNESELNILVSNIIKNEDVNMAKKLGL